MNNHLFDFNEKYRSPRRTIQSQLNELINHRHGADSNPGPVYKKVTVTTEEARVEKTFALNPLDGEFYEHPGPFKSKGSLTAYLQKVHKQTELASHPGVSVSIR